jgi:hypothetical protein
MQCVHRKKLAENVKVGNKDWHTVQEGEGQDIDARFAALEGRVAMMEQDLIRTVGRPQVQNVASQLLAWLLGNNPRNLRNSTSFSTMAVAGNRLLSSACPPNLSVQRFAALADQVSDQRNASIRYPTWPELRQAVERRCWIWRRGTRTCGPSVNRNFWCWTTQT